MDSPPVEQAGTPADGRRKPLRALVRSLLKLVVAGFVVFAGAKLIRQWDPNEMRLDAEWALLATLPMLAAGLAQCEAWIRVTESISDRSIPHRAARAAYFASQLARFTPGKVGLPVVRIGAAGALGVPGRTIGVSILLEMLAWCATGGVIGFGALLFFPELAAKLLQGASQWSALFLGSALGLSILFMVFPIRAFPAWIRAKLGLEGNRPLIPYQAMGFQCVYWGLWWTHGYAIARAVNAAPDMALQAAGFFPVATLLGFVTLAAPGGLGVREAIIALSLAPTVGPTAATAAALGSRAVSLVSEVALWLATSRLK